MGKASNGCEEFNVPATVSMVFEKGESIKAVARELCVPESGVKSRLPLS